MSKPRTPHLIVLGGFLGAGKTAAMQRLAEHLTNQGIRVALVTNDQGSELVDTQLLRSCGFETREVTGGCFCCRFGALLDATTFLTSDLGPDVFVAEAVGSCTDLAATVTYPLRRLFGDRFTVAPLSVLVDPIRARRALGLDAGEHYSPDVEYIYMKQLEEADLIVMTKCDLLPDASINELGEALSVAYPKADVVAVSSRDGLQLDEWFHRLLYEEQRPRPAIEVDYDTYASGESRLGWLNATLHASSSRELDGNVVLQRLASALHERLNLQQASVAHLKMSLLPHEGSGTEIASINLVRSDFHPEAGARLSEPFLAGQIIVNLRAEGAPGVLGAALRECVEASNRAESALSLRLEHFDCFSPGRPQPTHRMSGVPLAQANAPSQS